MAQEKRPVVGLTGGVASGKSTVAQYFANRGVFVMDVDDVSRSLTAPGGEAISAIAATFPLTVRGGVLDRNLLRETVFAKESERKRLESILHPMIREKTQRQLDSAEAQNSVYQVLVVPLLFETGGYRDLLSCAVLIDVPPALQLARIVKSRGLTEEIASQIIAAQWSREQKLARAQFVIDNDCKLSTTEAQADSLHHVFMANFLRPKGAQAERTSLQ